MFVEVVRVNQIAILQRLKVENVCNTKWIFCYFSKLPAIKIFDLI